MLKSEELTNPDSCINRAREDEMTFVLLGRDAAAPVAIRAWISERLRLGKNMGYDKQILDALEVARTMESSPSAPAATQEQPGARSSECKNPDCPVGCPDSHTLNFDPDAAATQEQPAGSADYGHETNHACEHGIFTSENHCEKCAPGSPRKVGEDGARPPISVSIEDVIYRMRREAATVMSPPPMPHGKGWASAVRFWADEMERTLAVLRPSSVPVGEQKD